MTTATIYPARPKDSGYRPGTLETSRQIEEHTAMHTSIMLQHIHAAQLDGERLQRALHNEQLRIARETRPSLATQIRTMIGTMLISVGERLYQQPAHRTLTTSPGVTATRSA